MNEFEEPSRQSRTDLSGFPPPRMPAPPGPNMPPPPMPPPASSVAMPPPSVPPVETPQSTTPASDVAPELLDVLPVLERRDDSVWSTAERRRDELYATLHQICRERGFNPLLLKSNEFVQPTWVSIEAWIPRNGRDLTKRRSATIKIAAKEFHRFKFECTVELRDGDWKKTFARLRDFRPEDAGLVAQFVLGGGPKPPFSPLELRDRSWKLWKPKNTVQSLTPDPVSVIARALPWLALALLIIGVGARTPALVLIGLLALFAGVPIAALAKRRRPVVLSSGKPKAEPRDLVRIDSWQAMISGLGADAEVLRQRLLGLVATPPIEGCEPRVERIWYWGLDGTVEREQIVMTLRRGIVFCHIYPYDRELYVGWDAHLNRGQWIEQAVVSGRSNTGEYTQLRRVESGVQQLTEYDLIDLSCLSEWIHAQLVMLVQHLMKERQVDQEIDFKIIRGNRDDLNRGRRDGDSDPQAGGNAAAAARRLGGRLLRVE